MMPGTGSRTAMRTAIYRAQHQSVDRAAIFRDPFAEQLVGQIDDSAERIEKTTGLRLFMAARARLAEDLLAGSGARRYIVLGAGLDTFALRNPDPDLEVIEIDHPDTQAAKRARYAELGWAPRVTYLAVDFEHTPLADALATLPEKSAFASWLGVTFYLEPATTLATLRVLAANQISVVFDYGPPSDRFDALSARTAIVGEPFKGSFTIEACAEAAQTAGFASSRDYDGGELIAHYLGRPASGAPSFARLLHAVAP
jgi:methyltransferase (TIGR00027 family)